MREDDYSVLEGFYTLHETIGRGGFAKVKKATHILTGERVAIKILDKLSLGDDLPRVAREIETLKTLSHPHICKLYQVIHTENKIFMIMEYCRGGELFDYIVQRDRLEESEARRFFRQIASAVAYIHGKGIAHRDLKPENILLDSENNVKLIDFGLCAAPPGGMNTELETCCGSPAYAAPELIKGERYIGTLADVWSMGVLLFALLNGFLPFDDPSLGALYRKIQAGKYDEPRWLSEGSKNILRCMLQVNPQYRVSVEDLLRHSWCLEAKLEVVPVVSAFDLQNHFLDIDVLRLMAEHMGHSVNSMECKISKWDYEDYDVATYFLLSDRKFRFGARHFRTLGMNIDRPRLFNNRVQKSLESEFLECDSTSIESINMAPARPYHSSMEGGLDDCRLLQIGSPKAEPDENKENDEVDFPRPRIPTPKRMRLPAVADDTAVMNSVLKSLSPARSAESVFVDPLKTPVREKWLGIGQNSPNMFSSPAKRKVLGSIERGLDKMRLMLTPRTGKTKNKLKTIIHSAQSGKGAFNISATGSTDPDCVIAELKGSLLKAGIDCEQKGYRLIGKQKQGQLKFELEVVSIESLNVIGIRRKRTHGDSWAYKKVVEQVLTLSGVCPRPAAASKPKAPLQTQV